MQLRRAVVAALAWVFAVTVWAADADVVAQGEAMVRAARYAEAYQLLAPLEDRLAGDIKYDYLLARSALETGRPSQASFIYERILALEPNYVGVRLEMGRAYLALGDYARAKLEFETVLRFSNLPPDVREQATIYGRAADDRLSGKKTVGYGYVEYGVGYDSNPTSATSIDPIIWTIGSSTRVLDLDTAQLERSDQYHALSLGGELSHALNDGLSVYAGADARIRGYRDIETADYGTLDGRAGVGFAEGQNNARLGFAVGRYWLDDEKVRDSAGLTAEYRRLIGQRNQVSINTQLTAFRYIPEAFEINDFDLLQTTFGWLRVINDGRGAAGLSLLAGLEDAAGGREDGDKPLYGARLTFQNSLGERVGAFFLAGVQRGKYKEFNTTFGRQRVDKLYDVVAGLTWTFAPGWSLRPQLLYLKNESNIDLFKYERTDVSLNLRRDF